MFFLNVNGKKINDIREVIIRPEKYKDQIIIFVMINTDIFSAIENNTYFNVKNKDIIYFCKLKFFEMEIPKGSNNEYNENGLLKVVLEIKEEKHA